MVAGTRFTTFAFPTPFICSKESPRKGIFMLREPITVDPRLVEEIVTREEAEFRGRTPRSHEIHERAKKTMPAGVSSSFQAVSPYPLFISHAQGSHIWDYDGNEYADFHLGFGSLLVGHAHPVLVEALRVARAHAGRDKIVKIEGSYHGHHDTVLMSTKPPVEAAGPADRPNSVPASKGIPSDVKNNIIIAPFNDAEALERILTEHKGEVAAVITEPVLMNVGIILPEEGYLKSLREITRRHDVLLIFDEVKTGVTVAPGGITELYPVEPDLICLAKSIGGGTPIGAFGGREDIMRHINHEEVVHLGTFNGNPMSMRAGLVTLTQILTLEAHAHASGLSKQLADGYVGIIDEFDVPMHVAQIGAKGCAMFRYERARNYRAWWEIDLRVSYAYWLFLANRGILFPPGFDDQWTVSIQHTQSDIDQHLHVIQQFVQELIR